VATAGIAFFIKMAEEEQHRRAGVKRDAARSKAEAEAGRVPAAPFTPPVPRR
jgi:hypothetical protein